MHDLVVVRFDGKDRASEVLTRLLQLAYDGTIDLFDGVAVHRTDDGKLRIDDSIQPREREGAGWGAFWGAWLGALIVGTFTAGLSVAAAAASTGLAAAASAAAGAVKGAHDSDKSKLENGVTDEFVRQVSGAIQPGDSAVFAVLETKHRDRVIDQFLGYGGTVLRTSLPPDIARRIQESRAT